MRPTVRCQAVDRAWSFHGAGACARIESLGLSPKGAVFTIRSPAVVQTNQDMTCRIRRSDGYWVLARDMGFLSALIWCATTRG